MHAVLATYYGHLPHEKVSSAHGANLDIEEPLALMRVWDEVKHDERAIHDADIADSVRALGGPEAALQKISSRRDLLEAKDEGEEMGRQLALRALKRKYAHALHSKSSRQGASR